MSHSSPSGRRRRGSSAVRCGIGININNFNDIAAGGNATSNNIDNMALASDTLFDKFGLWQGQENDASLANLMNNDPFFEGLDLNLAEEALDDLLATASMSGHEVPVPNINIKEEPLEAEEEAEAGAAAGDLNDILDSIKLEDHFVFDEDVVKTENVEDDSIKSDCMWSSSHIVDQAINRSKRRRDVSLTLSECEQGFLAIKDFDVDMLSKVEASLGSTPPLGGSPPFMSSFGAYADDTPMATSEESDTASAASEDDEEDQEIDVVSHDNCDAGSSARTRHAIRKTTANNYKHQRIEAGRSLLRPKKQQQQQQPPQLTEKHKTILDRVDNDHCYFLARPANNNNNKSSAAAEKPKDVRGLLTPNESSEDDEEILMDSHLNTGTTTILTPTSRTVDKRKIAQAVQSLIKKQQPQSAGAAAASSDNGSSSSKTSTIKFKFRMKFKSTSPQPKPGLMKQHHRLNQASSLLEQKQRERRKSASKNAYCPAPHSPSKSPLKHSRKSISPAAGGSIHSSCKRTSPVETSSIEEGGGDKCREIRDLHNSMERQRRVELRNNFDQLKELVPELADADKASKLTILKKAMDYCHLLANMDLRARRDRDREASRGAMLKKKLVEAQTRHDRAVAGIRTSSGRMASVWHSNRF